MINAIYRNQPLGINLSFVDKNEAPVDITGGTITVDYWSPADKGNPEPTGTWADGVDGIAISVIDGLNGIALCDVPENTLDTIGNWTDQPRALLTGKNWPGTAQAFAVLEKGKVPE